MRHWRPTLSLFVLVAPLVILAADSVRAQEPQGIKVRGDGIVAARPDIATVTLTMTTLRESSPEAFSRAAELSDALLAIARDAGIAANDVRTANITLNAEYQVRDGVRILAGWRATRTLSIRIRDFTRIAPVLERAVDALGGEGMIQGISYGIEDTDRLVSIARAEAFANARAAAEELARLAGMRLGEVTSIEEISSTAPTPVRPDTPAATARPSPTAAPAPIPAAAASVEPGEISVRVILVVVFSLVRPVGAE